MLYNATVVYKAFPHAGLPEPMEVQLIGATVEDALEDAFRGFNYAIPGKTGEMADKFRVRSMCMGDEVIIGKDTWVCASVGWVNLTENPGILEDDVFVKGLREPRQGRDACEATQ